MRDTHLELALLNQIAELTQRVEGVNPATLVNGVFGRLEKGAREYGDNSFRGKDPLELLAEADEEPVDAVAWMVLFLERMKPLVSEELWDELRMIVLERSVHLAAAHAAGPRLRHITTQVLREMR